MRVIHGSWLIEIERNCGRTILRLFCYDFTAVALLNDQPGVVGVNARPISKPAETGIRKEFVHAASDRESESLPLKLTLRSEPIVIVVSPACAVAAMGSKNPRQMATSTLRVRVEFIVVVFFKVD